MKDSRVTFGRPGILQILAGGAGMAIEAA